MSLSRKPIVGGIIKYYGLEDWWINSFTESERHYIRLKFHPMGLADEMIDEGTILSFSTSITTFLNSLETWFRSKEDKTIQDKIHKKLLELAEERSSVSKELAYNPGSKTGFIGYYKIEDWWIRTFTKAEREYVSSSFQPLGYEKNCIMNGEIDTNISIVAFLYVLQQKYQVSFEKIAIDVYRKIEKKYLELVNYYGEDQPGFLCGRHYSSYPKDVIELERQGKVDEAIPLLLQLVVATETEYRFMHDINSGGVAPWYYEKLAIIYRKQKDIKSELQILDRFAQQKHANGVKPAILLKRLEEVKEKSQKIQNQ